MKKVQESLQDIDVIMCDESPKRSKEKKADKVIDEAELAVYIEKARKCDEC